MEKLRKLTQMTEHSEQYSDEEWQEIFGGETVSDEQVETEWKRFEQQHFPRHNRQWLKMAASFIGILMLSGIAWAAVQIIGSHDDSHGNAVEATNTVTIPQAAKEKRETAAATPHTVVFKDAELQEIVDSLTYYYQVKPAYRNASVRHLRLYYEWDQHNSIGDIASQISNFDHVSISLKGDSIIIE
jgi:hypothetical protein